MWFSSAGAGEDIELDMRILTALNSVSASGRYASLKEDTLDYECLVRNMNGGSTRVTPRGDRRDCFRTDVQGRTHSETERLEVPRCSTRWSKKGDLVIVEE